jgi:hypothetical protein
MEFGKTEDILGSIVKILNHIEGVQKDVLELSERSAKYFHGLLEANGMQADDSTIQALQYQDIISQQIGAVSDAIAAIEINISVYLKAVKEDKTMLEDSMEKLSSRLIKSLELAKEKKKVFMGNAIDENSGSAVEFF